MPPVRNKLLMGVKPVECSEKSPFPHLKTSTRPADTFGREEEGMEKLQKLRCRGCFLSRRQLGKCWHLLKEDLATRAQKGADLLAHNDDGFLQLREWPPVDGGVQLVAPPQAAGLAVAGPALQLLCDLHPLARPVFLQSSHCRFK